MRRKDKKKKDQATQMSIYDYEEKYVKHRNAKAAGLVLRLIVGVVGLFLAWGFVSLTMDIWEKNEYAGYVATAVSVILYIVIFLVPVIKIFQSDYFITDVNSRSAHNAKRHNRQVRRNVALKIIELNDAVDGLGWYDDKIVREMETAVIDKNDAAIKDALSRLYGGKVKKSAKDVIFKCAVKSAMYSAVSQTSRTDAALVAVINLQMIKDIIYMYGFRPADSRLLKIFAAVVRNSLVSYGLGSVKLGNTVVKTMGDAAKGIPFLGTAISALVDSSVQGLTNGTLTVVIGFQTIRYLNTEYKLQNLLDGVQIAETEEEMRETCAELEKHLKKSKHGKADGALTA